MLLMTVKSFALAAVLLFCCYPAPSTQCPDVHMSGCPECSGIFVDVGQETFGSTARFTEDKDLSALIRSADKRAAAGDWTNALRQYQEALETALEQTPDVVHPSGKSDEDKVVIYMNAVDYCRKRLLRMDKRALAAYQAAYEGKAAAELSQALEKRAFDVLPEIGERFPFTESGLRALTLAGDTAVEGEDYSTAANYYRRVLEARITWPPEAESARKEYAVLTAKAARAYAGQGRRDGLTGLRALLLSDKRLGLVEVMCEGRKKTLADILQAIINSFKPLVLKPAEEYPTFGGDASRGMVMHGSAGKMGGPKWRYTTRVKDKYFRATVVMTQPGYRPFLLSGMPAAEKGRLYVNTGRALLALDEFDGTEAFVYRYHNIRQTSGQVPPPVEFCTVHKGIAYILVPSSRGLVGGSIDTCDLHAIDTRTGERLWSARQQLGLHLSEQVSGTVLARNGEVLFLTLKDEKSQISSYLLCVDAETGKLKWRCYFGARVGHLPNYRMRKLEDIIALDGNTAIIASSASAVAAVDLRDGRLKWAAKYHQDFLHTLRMSVSQHDAARPLRWSVNPAITFNGSVIFAPKDSSRLYCMDTETGHIKWAHSMPDLCYLAGIDDGTLFVVEKKIMAIDAETGKLVYVGKDRINTPVGRPALTKSALYISTLDALLKFDRETKKLTRIFSWREKDLYPGNLLSLKSGLYVVNSEQIAAFYDPQVLATLGAQLRKNPADPILRYRRGRALLAHKRWDEALSDFEKAGENAAPAHMVSGRPLSELIDEGLHDSYMALSALKAAFGKAKDALNYAQAALKFAATDTMRIDALAAIGRLHEKAPDMKSWRSAIDSYQRIIADYPNQLFAFDGFIQQRSDYYAANRTGAMLKERGRALYADYEAEAAKLLADVEKNPTVSGCMNIYGRYPNSIAALKAMRRLAVIHEKEGRKPLAAAVLKVVSRRFEDSPDLAPALVSLQRAAWDCAEYVPARSALERLAKMPPDLTVEIDGAKRNAVEYAKERLRKLDGELAVISGTAQFGGKATLERKIQLGGETFGKNSVESGLLYVEGPRPRRMVGKLLTTRNGVVECRDLETGRALWDNRTPALWLGMWLSGLSGGQYVREVFPGHAAEKSGMVRGTYLTHVNGKQVRGKANLQQALSGVKPGDKVKVVYHDRNRKECKTEIVVTKTPPAFTGRITRAWYNGEGNLVVVGRLAKATELRCLDIETGETLWRRSIPGTRHWRKSAGQLLSNNILACAEGHENKQTLKLLDLSTGTIVARYPLALNEIDQIALAGDNCVLMTGRGTERECHVFDVLTGTERFRIALGDSSTSHFTLAGDRLLAVTDDRRILHVVDLWTGSEIHSEKYLYSCAMHTSDRYLLIRHWRQRDARVFDAPAASPRPRVNPGTPVLRALLDGERIFFQPVVSTRDKAALAACSASSGKTIWTKTFPGLSRIQRYHVFGDYLVLYAGSLSRKKGKDKDTTSVDLIVVHAESGERIRNFRQTAEGLGTVYAMVVDGRLCVLVCDTLFVVK